MSILDSFHPARLGLMNLLPLQFLTLMFAGWVNRHQQGVIEYLHEKNRALREQVGGVLAQYEVGGL
jgi:hypothetical protein